jgi:outer membrane protein TolC
MPPSTAVRALASVALAALVLAGQPAGAQTTTPGTPATTTTPRPVATPATTIPTPAPFPSAAASPGARTQSPSSLPGSTGTPPPGAPVPASANASGGSAAINASAIPTLAPADQATPLPFPAYGTPAPVTQTRTAAGVPQVITLPQAVLIAYARSPLLASARADVEIATAPVGLAQSALFPAVTGDASTTRAHRQAGGTTTATAGNGTTTTFNPNTTTNSLSVSLQQLIFDGGRVAAQIRAARATQSASIATYQRQLQTVAFNVATAYYNTLAAQRQTQVAQTTVLLDQVEENLVSAQIRAGTAARTDLATAQLPTAQARVSVVRSQANEQVQLATFANTLGLDADVAVQPKDDVPAVSATAGTLAVTPAFPTPTYQTAVTRALALRPDLTAQQQDIASNRESLRAARLGNFPNVNGSASYGTTSTDPSGGTFRNAGSIGLALTVPFYDRGVTKAQVAQAQGQLDRALAQLQIAQQGVQLNVRSTLVNLVAAYAALDQTNAELAKAQEVLRATQAQYRAGVTTLPLLLNAQVGLTQALTDEVTAVYTVRQAEQALLYAEGTNAAG